MYYLITGGTGFLGSNLTDILLSQGHKVGILTRRDKSADGNLTYIQWNGKKIPDEAGNPDVIVNLAGTSLADQRWNSTYKRFIRDSRVDSSVACVEFIKSLVQKPKVFLAGSAIGYYGGDSEGEKDESSQAGDDFLGKVCRDWEYASKGSGIRTVHLRTGVVFDSEEGPLPEMVKPFKFYVGGKIGDGTQYIPWIHIEDWIAAALFCVEKESLEGPVNICAPEPAQQKELAEHISGALGKPNLVTAPKFALKLLMGEQSIIAWGSTKAIPKVLNDAGFKWKFPDLKSAIEDLLTD